jgi:Protein of unknown function (DUF2971)
MSIRTIFCEPFDTIRVKRKRAYPMTAGVTLPENDYAHLHALSIFLPSAFQRLQSARQNNQFFAHYTSAEAAMKIVSSKTVWLRNTRAVNDWSEIKFGVNRVIERFNRTEGADLWAALNAVEPNLQESIAATYDSRSNDYIFNTYAACVSEHLNEEVDIGRLSMWRAYANRDGVAIIINGSAFYTNSNALGVFTYPIDYKTAEEAKRIFEQLVANIASSTDFLRTLPRDHLTLYVLQMIEYFSFSLKHPAFKEEREWKIIHRPSEHATEAVKKTVQTIGGVPQLVYELPMNGEHGLPEANLATLIERVLIGPTQYPTVVFDAMVETLRSAGVPDAIEKVFVTDIPLRT